MRGRRRGFLIMAAPVTVGTSAAVTTVGGCSLPPLASLRRAGRAM